MNQPHQKPRVYEIPTLRRRVTRPLHSRRDALIEAAEAVFKPKVHDDKKQSVDAGK